MINRVLEPHPVLNSSEKPDENYVESPSRIQFLEPSRNNDSETISSLHLLTIQRRTKSSASLNESKMKLAIAALLASSAAAFAPVAKKASSIALKAFENEIGSQPPLGFYVSCHCKMCSFDEMTLNLDDC